MIKKQQLIKLITKTLIGSTLIITPSVLVASNKISNLINNFKVYKNASNFYVLELTLGLADLSLLDTKTISLTFTNINTKVSETKLFPFLKVTDSTIRLIIDEANKLNDLVITKITLKDQQLHFADHLKTNEINLNQIYVDEQTKIALHQRISLIVGSVVLGVSVVVILIIAKYYKKRKLNQKSLPTKDQEKKQ